MPRARRRRLTFAAPLALLFLLVGARAASADEVEDLIELIESKPPDMERQAWKEKRRDAARRLGDIGDERAVPVLVRVVETEQFDAIAEISIEALGKIGDERAAGVLREVVGDQSRDRYVRQAARRALRRIGAPVEAEEGEEERGGGSAGGAGGGGAAGEGAGGSVIELDGGLGLGSTRVDIPKGPAFPEDALAVSERFTFAAGGANLSYDTVREIAALEGDVRALYERSVDREKSAYRYGVEAGLAGGAIDLPNTGGAGQNSSSVVFQTTVDGEGRFYVTDRPLYGIVQGAAVGSYTGVRVNRPGDNDTEESRLGADLHLAVGVGYGRSIDVGAALRLKRIELALREARALGRPITPDLAERIFAAWWALRDEQGAYHHLVVTVAILREAGVLLGEPDAALTYKILQILLDGQLDHRRRGFDVHVGFSESFLLRDDELTMMSDVQDGRIEALIARARYGRQSEDGESELVGEAFARYRVFAPDGDLSPWAAGATGAWRNYFYNDHYDPIGALEVTALLGVSNQGGDGDDTAGRLAGGVGWVWSPNRASRLRLAGEVAMENKELFLGVTFEAVYGLLDVGYIGKSAY